MAGWLKLRPIIYGALEALGVPVFFMEWKPLTDEDTAPDTYITFQEPLAQDGLMADNQPWERERYWQVDIWSVAGTEELADQVRDAMTQLGFIVRDEGDVPDGTGTYHRRSRWLYYEEVN